MSTNPDPPTSITGEPVDPDHLGLALRSVAAGSMAGLGLVSAALWLVRTLQATGAAPREPGPTDFVANLILFGWIGAGMGGGVIAWTLMASISSNYRRGGLAMVAGFGTLLLAFVTAPVDSFLGPAGLLGLVALSALVFLLAMRRRRKRRLP